MFTAIFSSNQKLQTQNIQLQRECHEIIVYQHEDFENNDHLLGVYKHHNILQYKILKQTAKVYVCYDYNNMEVFIYGQVENR